MDKQASTKRKLNALSISVQHNCRSFDINARCSLRVWQADNRFSNDSSAEERGLVGALVGKSSWNANPPTSKSWQTISALVWVAGQAGDQLGGLITPWRIAHIRSMTRWKPPPTKPKRPIDGVHIWQSLQQSSPSHLPWALCLSVAAGWSGWFIPFPAFSFQCRTSSV